MGPRAAVPGLAVLICASLTTGHRLAECELTAIRGCELEQPERSSSSALAWGRKGSGWADARCQ